MNTPRPSASARPPLLYQISLILVAATMVVLPCLYVALTALAIWGVHWFATHEFLAIWQWPIGTNRLTVPIKLVCSFTPLFVGGAVTLAMIKPLFARRPAHMQPLALDPKIEPGVYSLVGEICGIVGAPAPKRVELNCALNASASFARGLGGFFGNRLILTLGMPLVAGLTQRELAGVIAHEFGHFRQGAGMRLSYLIRSINFWFARVIYERDAVDEAIVQWAEDTESALSIIMFSCVRMGVGFSRGVLWVLMMGGHAVSAVLLRQMEYDADRQEIRLAGSAAFESTMYQFAALGGALTDIHADMRRLWRQQQRLPDNLPLFVECRVAQLSAEQRAALENTLAQTKTRPLDTHPSAADRVRRARQLNEPGYGLSDAPARALFENFGALSRLVTLAHYEDDLQIPADPAFLIPLEQVLQAEERERQAAAARTGAPPPAPTAAKEAAAETNGATGAAERPRPKVRMLAFDPSQLPGKKLPNKTE